ncbi:MULTISPECIES: IS5 family transposase, partial [unclassified Streptomyces]|nr:IS5 family transposase [Streptomyces sp. SID8357]
MVGRGELTDAAWERIEPLLPGIDGRGRPWRDHRQVINGVLWRLRTGAPWRDLPERYGPWQTAYERFARWEADGTWARLLEQVQVRDDSVGAVEWT